MTAPKLSEAARKAAVEIESAIHETSLGEGHLPALITERAAVQIQFAQLIQAAIDEQAKPLAEALSDIETWTRGFASDFENRISARARKALEAYEGKP